MSSPPMGSRPYRRAPSSLSRSSDSNHGGWHFTFQSPQKQLSCELKTDKVATSCAQTTRLPGFFNHKYRPAPMVAAQYGAARRVFAPSDFPATGSTAQQPVPGQARARPTNAARDAIERARRSLPRYRRR